MNSFYLVCCLYLVAKRSCKAYSIFFQSSDALVLWENNIYSPRPFIDCAKRRYGSKSYQMEWIYLISLLCQLVISGIYIYWIVRKYLWSILNQSDTKRQLLHQIRRQIIKDVDRKIFGLFYFEFCDVALTQPTFYGIWLMPSFLCNFCNWKRLISVH